MILSLRRKHKKGQEEEQTKKRTRRTQKFQRAIVGASLTDILAKRNMKPEIRKAQREQAIKYVFFKLFTRLKELFMQKKGLIKSNEINYYQARFTEK